MANAPDYGDDDDDEDDDDTPSGTSIADRLRRVALTVSLAKGVGQGALAPALLSMVWPEGRNERDTRREKRRRD
jgi:hypothetical protein